MPLAEAVSGLSHIRFSLVERTKRGITGPVVYYLERADGLVKIGTTHNFPGRRKDLVRQHGPLTLLAWEGGSYRLEDQRHEQFALDRWGASEWFTLSPELRNHIADIRFDLRERGLA